jgi:hypothetical protein
MTEAKVPGSKVPGSKVTLAEAERQAARVVDQLEAARWQLLGIALSLRESPDNEADAEVDTEAELRRVLECVLADRLLPALGDLRNVLTRE